MSEFGDKKGLTNRKRKAIIKSIRRGEITIPKNKRGQIETG